MGTADRLPHMPLHLRSPVVYLAALCVLAMPALPLHAQDAARDEVVLPPENVRYDYAQVLAVRPVYQVLRTTSLERVCDVDDRGKTVIARVAGAVRGRLSGPHATTREEREAGLRNCRMQQVPREFRRAIAFDVDYVYKGSKFRTRMARDPGNRLRIRISITPQPID